MGAPRSAWRFLSILVVACWWLPEAAAADSILAGTVTDAVTRRPVAGAEVRIEYAGLILGAGTTDIDGLYSVPFTVPASAPAVVAMILSAHSGSHDTGRSSFQVSGGAPVGDAHDIALFPAGVAACRSQTGHSVIVGHFLPPVGSSFPDLSTRVARSLDFALTTRLQTAHLDPGLQPSFEPCDAAKPRTAKFAASYAKALRADAFVLGDIAETPPHFEVRTYVSDAHDLLSAPAIATSRSVDLANPSGAEMAGDTHAAVLASVAAGLARKGDCVTAITVLAVAEQLVDMVPAYVTALRRDCEAAVPNAGLLGGRP